MCLSDLCSADCLRYNNKGNSLEQVYVDSVNWSASWLYLKNAALTQLQPLQRASALSGMLRFLEAGATITERNKHQLNVNVINSGEEDRIVLQAQQKEDKDAEH